MAIKPTDNEAFYREVDEELRREQMKTAWQRYGWLAIAAVLLLLAAIGGWIYWQHRQEQQAAVHGEQLIALFDQIAAGRTEGVAAKLDALAAEGSPGHRAAALLSKADMAVATGDDAAAVAAFKAVAADDQLAAPYRELALLRQTTLEFDSLQPSVVIERLGPLAKPGNPWFGSAGELIGVAQLKAGRRDQAGQTFAAMARDSTVPASIRSRALQMAGALGVDAIEEDDAAGAVSSNKEASE